MVEIPSILEMLEAGVHFGHRESKWHPKMAPYIFGVRQGIHIIDLDKTREALEKALEAVRAVAARGGVVLFVGTKKQAQDIIKREATKVGMPYINQRWLGGTLTNFAMIKSVIKRFEQLDKELGTEAFEKYTKKEQLEFSRELERLRTTVEGLAGMHQVPDLIFIIDLKHEKTAWNEAQKQGIPVVALCDTNINPEEVAFAIPSNDDALKTIELMTSLVAKAVAAGQAEKIIPTASKAAKSEATVAPVAAAVSDEAAAKKVE